MTFCFSRCTICVFHHVRIAITASSWPMPSLNKLSFTEGLATFGVSMATPLSGHFEFEDYVALVDDVK